MLSLIIIADGLTVLLLVFSLWLIRSLHRPVYFAHALCVIVFYVPLLLAFQVMVGLKLDGEDLDWKAVFTPLYILTGSSFFSFLLTYCIHGCLPPME